MVYCSGGMDSGQCSTFDQIVASPSTASIIKNEILANLNVVAAQRMGVATGKIATSYYKDALSIPVSRGVDAPKSVSPNISNSIETVERFCKINNLTQAGGCL